MDEGELEVAAMGHLLMRGFSVERQARGNSGRYDIVVRLPHQSVCIEIKRTATTTCVRQLDRYSSGFDGLILFCYRASRPMKAILEKAKGSAKIPLELIEARGALPLA